MIKKTSLFLCLGLSFFLSGCLKTETPQGTSTGNPVLALQIKSYSALSHGSFHAQAVSNLILCFKRLRFKPVSGIADNIDLNLGEVTVVTTGTPLIAVSVPAGTYSRVEFDLEPQCPSLKTIQLVNSHGSFSTNDLIEIRFDGNLVVSGTDQNVDLDIQSIVTALGTVTANSQIKLQAESVSGSF